MKIIRFPFFFFLIFTSAASFAQDTLVSKKAVGDSLITIKNLKDSLPIAPPLIENKTLTVSYKIATNFNKKPGIEETYNGGNKTIFIQKNKIRVRLVSLMRIQSIYFVIAADTNIKNKTTFVKESGKEKYKTKLEWKDWKYFNRKYDSLKLDFKEDTMTIIEHLCKKVNLTLRKGKEITAYYTTDFGNKYIKLVDPLFAQVPGLVLHYELKEKGKKISYTATEITENSISQDVFRFQGNGFKIKKLSATLADAEEE